MRDRIAFVLSSTWAAAEPPETASTSETLALVRLYLSIESRAEARRKVEALALQDRSGRRT